MSKEMKRYLGIDWGEKRIGLAIAESELNFALPLDTVSNVSELLEVIDEEGIDIIVLGEPTKMSGEEANNPLWLSFLDQLREKTDCSIKLIDERLSSLAADALIGGKKDKANRDEVAATLILQNYLDGHGRN